MFSLPSLLPSTPLAGTSLTPAREESVPSYFIQGYSTKTFPLFSQVPESSEVILVAIPPEYLPQPSTNYREIVVEVAPLRKERKVRTVKAPRFTREQYRDYFRSLPAIPRADPLEEGSQGLSLPLPLPIRKNFSSQVSSRE